jgi:hypothetical protein
MAEVRNWRFMQDMSARLLKERTGQDTVAWNARIREQAFKDEAALRAWLTAHGVTGYPRSHLMMETFGYPDFLTASAEALIDGQYADRPQLRPIFDAVVAAASSLGEVIVQARKGYVSLVSPRRTFARVQATTRNRVDLALRLEGRAPGGRLSRSHIHETMPVQLGLTSTDDLDEEALALLQQAYEENC